MSSRRSPICPARCPLSLTRLETWRCRRGRVLTFAAYEAAGGVHGATASTAEWMYGTLAPARKAGRPDLRPHGTKLTPAQWHTYISDAS
ncbi:hypothetical protein ACFW93_44675 [Streptomyces canus]|uniref:nSTAND1 domain-containing NTPase n=1 Tax=Streptomyces canus TaxID=58343 RepID=UPI003677E44D